MAELLDIFRALADPTRLRIVALLREMELAIGELAVGRDCGRIEWSVLDWNSPAIGFYESLGAKPVGGWTVYRLTGESISELARG